MNYELAKKLKDGGFPQGQEPFLLPPEAIITKPGSNVVERIDRTLAIYAPSLSELIGACGDGFISLHHLGSSWYADHETLQDPCDGTTPDIAVANLWLALNPQTPN